MVASNWRCPAACLPIAALFAFALPAIANSNCQRNGDEISQTEYTTANASALAASQTLNDPFPYYFPDQNEPANLFPMPLCNGIPLEEATIDQLQDYMSHGKLTSVQLVMCYMQRESQTREYIKCVPPAITSTGSQDTLLSDSKRH